MSFGRRAANLFPMHFCKPSHLASFLACAAFALASCEKPAETYYTRYGEPLTKKTQADAEAARRGLMECRLEQK